MGGFGSSDRQSHRDRVSRDNTIVNKTATATLTPAETYVSVIPAAATTITLPPVGACPDGHRIAIFRPTASANALTIEDNANDDVGGFTDVTITKANVLVVFENIGQRHWVMTSAKVAGAHMVEATLDFTT